MNRLHAIAAALALLTLFAHAQRYEANWASLDKRPIPAWFNQAKFGIFICYGPYSVPAWGPKNSYAEWYGWQMRQNGSPTQKFHEANYGKDFDYRQFGPMLKAEMYDPAFWCDLFVRAGAKYVVFSSNFHDGFCTWPSPYSPGWNAMEVGPKRDVLGELFDAGRRRGLKMGIYTSLFEWYHPLWLTDRKRYVDEHYIPQFKEVVTRYKPAFIFADGEWEGDEALWHSLEMTSWLFNDSPCKDEVVVNDRLGGSRGKHGTVYESEYGGGNMGPAHPWQEDRGIGSSYGYNRNESIDDYSSAGDLIRMLAKCAAGGGNLLLDIGPSADGRIPVIMQQRLLEIGAWLKVNGEAIYGSKASPFWPRRFPWGVITAKPGRLYLHVDGRPADSIKLPGLRNKVVSAYLLADRSAKVATKAGSEGVVVDLPRHMPDPNVSVIALDIKGEPVVESPLARPGKDGSISLTAAEAEIHGSSPVFELKAKEGNIGYWQNPADYISWKLSVTRQSAYEVEVTYSCAQGAEGSSFIIDVDGTQIQAKTVSTGSWDRFVTRRLGTVNLRPHGPTTLALKPGPGEWRSMGLARIVLRPVPYPPSRRGSRRS